jgi:hypothetical protein
VSAGHPTDDELLARLGRELLARDPAPETLHAAARDAFGLGRLGDELAELVADSALAASGARGGHDARLLSFRVDDLEAEVELRGGTGGTFDLTGVVSAAVCQVTVETPDGSQDVPVDELGRIRAAGVAGRMLRLALRRESGRTATTRWVLVG